MASWPRSLAAQLPYWSVFAAPVPGTQAQQGVVLLKDGHVAVAFELGGFAPAATDAAHLQSEAQAVAACLAALPPGFVLQASFETAPHPPDAAQSYARAGDPNAHPVLRRSRQARARMLQEDRALLQHRTLWWLGAPCPGCLPTAGRGPHSKRAQQQALEATVASVLQVAGVLRAKLMPHHPALTVLSVPALVACCHGALNPHRADVAPPPWPPRAQAGRPLADLLPLSALQVRPDGLTLGAPSLVWRALGVLRLPDTVAAGLWPTLLLDHAPTSPYRLVVTHRVPHPARATAQLGQRRKALWALVGSVFANHAARQAYEETEAVLARLQVGDGKLVHTSLTLLVSGATAAALEHNQTQLQEALAEQHLVAAPLLGDQLTGWLSTLPAYGQRARHTHPLLHDAAAHLTPRLAPDGGDSDADLLLHTRQRGLRKLSIRLKHRQDASAIMVGKTGSGKTFLFCALLKDGCLGLGGHAVVVDVKGPRSSAYQPLCALLGGQYVHLHEDADLGFTPFPSGDDVRLPDGSLDAHKLTVPRAMLAMMGGAGQDAQLGPEDVQHILGKVLSTAYGQAADPGRPLLLSDAVRAFDGLGPLSDHLQATADRLRERLTFWRADPLRRRLFDTPRPPPAHKQLTVFDFHGLDQDALLGTVLITALTGAIERTMASLPATTPKLFGFDEAWALFDGHAQAAALLNRLYRTARSFGACCYLLTQSHYDIAQSAAAQGVLQNVGLVYLMRHQADHRAAGALFGLHARAQAQFESLAFAPNAFAEALLLDTNAHRSHVLRYQPTPFDIWCDSSRPQELEMRHFLTAEGAMSLEQAIELLASHCPQGAPADARERKSILASLAAHREKTHHKLDVTA